MRLWSGPSIDPTLDPGTQSAILAIRARRLRVQRRFARILVSTVLLAMIGGGGTMWLSGGSSSKSNGPGASNVRPDDSPPLDLTQQVQELNDMARQLHQTP